MFTFSRKANYHETDKMGIIHHSNYIKWMEEARIAYMESLGYGFDKVEEKGIVSPVAGITITYKTPVLFNEVVDIQISLTRYSGVVQEVSYTFVKHNTSELCATATSKHCYLKDGKVVNLKHEIPELDKLFASELVTATHN
jgi:acyl-CoA thioester hydrolase